MQPTLIVLTAWIIFGGSHLLLSGTPLRAWMADRYGARGFTIVFAGVTVVTMLGLIWAAASYGDQGRPGLGISAYPAVRWGLGGVSALGAVLAIAGLINYPRSPMAILAQRQREQAKYTDFQLNPPSAIERVARHPFFIGLAIMMSAHMLLASTLAGAVYFGGFVVVAVIGIPIQDRKLRTRWENVYTAFEDKTSNIPFASKTGNQDNPEGGKWSLAVIVTVIFFGVFHPIWMYANGTSFAGLILAFGLLGTIKGLWANKRKV